MKKLIFQIKDHTCLYSYNTHTHFCLLVSILRDKILCLPCWLHEPRFIFVPQLPKQLDYTAPYTLPTYMPFNFRDRRVKKEYYTEFHGGLGKQSKLEASKSAQLVFKGNSKRAQQHKWSRTLFSHLTHNLKHHSLCIFDFC